MQSPLSRYVMLAKRWLWMIVLGVVLCGGGTYVISKLMHPVYQASALIILNMGTSTTGPFENTSASLAALPTYAQLLRNSVVLSPVVAQHRGLTSDQLNSMLTVNPQSNTQIIELDVKNGNPQFAAQIANEVSQSFAHYVDTQLPAAVQILPAQPPTTPVSPKPLPDAALGALAGLGLALALIVIFEWIDDRPGSPEEVQELLGLDTLTIIPKLSRKERSKNAEEVPAVAEGCRILCSRLNAAQVIKPFKLVMVTSALAGEGKSTIAANLASFLAMTGKRVLFVDADLRRPVLHDYFQIDNHHGLTSVFMEMWARLEVELDGQPTAIPTLHVLPAGVVPSNPAELLQSSLAPQLFDHFQKSQFDYVIFDTPPLLPVADAQILASYVQATVLVIDVSKIPRKVLVRAKQVLSKTRTRVIGVALNKSHWSEYGDIQQYLSDTQHAEKGINLTIPPEPPHMDRKDIAISETVPLDKKDIAISETVPLDGMNGTGDSDVTISIRRPQKDKGEKS